MSATIIVCPDCGQSFDPAIVRDTFRSSRGVKHKPRVGGQDVRTAGHLGGPHHVALDAVTSTLREPDRRALLATTALNLLDVAERALCTDPLLLAAMRVGATLVTLHERLSGVGWLWFVPVEELEDLAVECGGAAPEFARRVLVACEVVRHGAPWWHAWMQANGVSASVIAQGYRVGRSRRADVWLGLSLTEAQESCEMLPGLL